MTSTLEPSAYILTFDLVVLDVEVLDETDFTIYMREQKVLADVFKGWSLSHFHDIRKVIPSLVADDGL